MTTCALNMIYFADLFAVKYICFCLSVKQTLVVLNDSPNLEDVMWMKRKF